MYLKCPRGITFPPLTIPAPWVILRVGWPIIHRISHWWLPFVFFLGNRAGLKPTTFSLLLVFRVFLALLSPPFPPQWYSTFECCLLGLFFNNNIYIYIYRLGGVWVLFLRSQGARSRVISVLRECIWNAPVVSLFLLWRYRLPGLSLRRVVYPWVPSWRLHPVSMRRIWRLS